MNRVKNYHSGQILHQQKCTYMRPAPSYMRVLLGSDVISACVRLACFFMRLSCSICRSDSFTFCWVSIILACSSPKACGIQMCGLQYELNEVLNAISSTLLRPLNTSVLNVNEKVITEEPEEGYYMD